MASPKRALGGTIQRLDYSLKSNNNLDWVSPSLEETGINQQMCIAW